MNGCVLGRCTLNFIGIAKSFYKVIEQFFISSSIRVLITPPPCKQFGGVLILSILQRLKCHVISQSHWDFVSICLLVTDVSPLCIPIYLVWSFCSNLLTIFNQSFCLLLLLYYFMIIFIGCKSFGRHVLKVSLSLDFSFS